MSTNISPEAVCFAHWLVKTGRDERTPKDILVDVVKVSPETAQDAITQAVAAGYLDTDASKRFTWLTGAGEALITHPDAIRT